MSLKPDEPSPPQENLTNPTNRPRGPTDKGPDMADKPWKREERHAATLIGGSRFGANTGGRIDAESPQIVAQVKHVKRTRWQNWRPWQSKWRL